MAIRSFIAIELPRDIREALGRIQQKLRSTDARVRWVTPSNIHLTAKFLGDVDGSDVPKVCEVMRKASAETRPFELEVAGLGAFPAKGLPRTIWAGIRGDVETLGTLVEKIELGVAEEVCIRPERRAYHAHLTLGRVKSTRNAERLTEVMQACEPVELGTFTAKGLTLFMSELSSTGSVYIPMATTAFEA